MHQARHSIRPDIHLRAVRMDLPEVVDIRLKEGLMGSSRPDISNNRDIHLKEGRTASSRPDIRLKEGRTGSSQLDISNRPRVRDINRRLKTRQRARRTDSPSLRIRPRRGVRDTSCRPYIPLRDRTLRPGQDCKSSPLPRTPVVQTNRTPLRVFRRTGTQGRVDLMIHFPTQGQGQRVGNSDQ
jgi:hypothetical protein